MEIKTVLVKNHVKDCLAIDNFNSGSWDTPWAYVTEKATYGARNAPLRKNGSVRWIYVRCNCTHCPAEMAILENDLLRFISKDPK